MTSRFATFWTTIWLGILIVLALAWSPDSYATDNKPEPKQEQSQQQAQQQGQQQSQSVDQANSQAMNFEDELQAPASLAPAIAPTAPCYYSVGGALSIPGGSIGGGKAIKDEACELRENIRLGYQIGLVNEAYYLYCNGPGKNVPNCGQYEPVPKPEPTVAILQGDVCAQESINRATAKCVSK